MTDLSFRTSFAVLGSVKLLEKLVPAMIPKMLLVYWFDCDKE